MSEALTFLRVSSECFRPRFSNRLCSDTGNTVRFSGRLSNLSPFLWWTTSRGSSGLPSIRSMIQRCKDICLPFTRTFRYLARILSFGNVVPFFMSLSLKGHRPTGRMHLSRVRQNPAGGDVNMRIKMAQTLDK